ncbi:hypothetical protein HXY32_01670 [Candidatus Bathyarchaeota archaeon]|nr:hypothetical protein [Candidatus Bathyarchaeota archaeon]
MKNKFMLILSLTALLLSMMYMRLGSVEVKAPNGVDSAKIYGVKMLWNNSMSVNDVAVSKDGNYIAAVNITGLYYFEYNNSTPKWSYLTESAVLSAAISADGNYVAVGLNSGFIYYFANATTRVGEQSAPTWTTYFLGGAVERGTLDMSDDGEYAVAGGTGYNVFYYANCTKREGPNQVVTWGYLLPISDIFAVDLSPDGRYLALGGRNSSQGFVAYYKNANVAPYPTSPDWLSQNSIDSDEINDLAISNDGYSVVAIGFYYLTLHYWANATTLSGDPNATWTSAGWFGSVDMSADGNNVVAGSLAIRPGSLHFWSNATMRKGYQIEDWIALDFADVFDIAINDEGNIIAASAYNDTSYKVYFFKSDSNMIGEFDLLQYSPLVSMSGSGRITAIGGPGWDSLYVLELLVDDNPPIIENIYQIPDANNVYPNSSVAVYANVTDDYSGVKQVILTYTNDSETWFIVNMTKLSGNQYNGTIPQFPYSTNVTYVIIAQDNCNNTITTVELGYDLKYHVIPEFTLQIMLPLFILSTILAAVLRKRKRLA